MKRFLLQQLCAGGQIRSTQQHSCTRALTSSSSRLAAAEAVAVAVAPAVAAGGSSNSTWDSSGWFAAPQQLECLYTRRWHSTSAKDLSSSTADDSSSNSSSSSSRQTDMWQAVGEVEKMSITGIRPMTLKRLIRLQSDSPEARIRTAEWVRSELPVRLAHRLYDFHRLPFCVLCCPPIKEVYGLYVLTFERLKSVAPFTDESQLGPFVQLLEGERRHHDLSVDLMGQGVQRLRRVCRDIRLDSFLERFFYFRIGRRIMIDNLVAMQNPKPGWCGIVNPSCKPTELIMARAKDVRDSCRYSYGIAPHVVVSGNLETEFATIPEHLALIITEVLKNALRATVEFYTLGNSMLDSASRVGLVSGDEDLPEVKVEVYKGKKEVVIKVSDKGGGVPPHKLQAMWSFGYSTVEESNTRISARSQSLAPNFVRADMAGYGFGLPLSRAFARYFGGDIHVQSHFGIGTDVYITLNHIGDQEEALFFEERPDLRQDQTSSSPG